MRQEGNATVPRTRQRDGRMAAHRMVIQVDRREGDPRMAGARDNAGQSAPFKPRLALGRGPNQQPAAGLLPRDQTLQGAGHRLASTARPLEKTKRGSRLGQPCTQGIHPQRLLRPQFLETQGREENHRVAPANPGSRATVGPPVPASRMGGQQSFPGKHPQRGAQGVSPDAEIRAKPPFGRQPIFQLRARETGAERAAHLVHKGRTYQADRHVSLEC
jgi:hypothetical protein